MTDIALNNQKPEVPKSKLTKTHIILIIGFSVLAVAIGVIGFILLNKDDEKLPVDNTNAAGNFVIDEDNLAEVSSKIEDKVAEGMFECSMNTTWTFPDGKSSSSDAYLANVNSNSKPIYFEVILDDEKKTVYKSSIIPVGSKIKEIKLDDDLSKGTYKATCLYHLMDENADGTFTEYSKAGFKISLDVKK